MNIYLKLVLELCDLYYKFTQFFIYISLYMFHNQIIYIKCFGKNDEIYYLYPLLKLCIRPSFIPTFTLYNPYERLHLCYISYIKNSKIENLACSQKTAYDIQIKVNYLNHNENYEKRHIIAKKYIFVEMSQYNITENYKRIGWSLIDEGINVEGYKRILQLHNIDTTLDFTNADNLSIQKLKDDDLIF